MNPYVLSVASVIISSNEKDNEKIYETKNDTLCGFVRPACLLLAGRGAPRWQDGGGGQHPRDGRRRACHHHPALAGPPSFDFVARWFQDGEFPCSILFSVQRASLLSQSIHSTPTAFLYFLFITPHRPYIEKHGERQQRH